jgi:hypothetical protein
MVHDNSSGINAAGMSKPAMPRERAFRGRMDETAYPPFDSLPATQGPNQDQVRGVMVRALRRWLEANELFAIITGVVGALVVLSLLLVLGGYLIVTR